MDLIVLHKSLSPVQDRKLTAVVRVTDLPRMHFSKKGMYIASKGVLSSTSVTLPTVERSPAEKSTKSRPSDS